MDCLYSRYGNFVSSNGYFYVPAPSPVPAIIKGMRNGGRYFDEVGGYKVQGIRDLGVPGYDR